MDRVSVAAETLLAQLLALRTLSRFSPLPLAVLEADLQLVICSMELFVFVLPGSAAFYRPVTGLVEALAAARPSTDAQRLCPFVPNGELYGLLTDAGMHEPRSTLEPAHVDHLLAMYVGVARAHETALLLMRQAILEKATISDEEAELGDNAALLRAAAVTHTTLRKWEVLLCKAALLGQHQLFDASAEGTFSEEFLYITLNYRATQRLNNVFRGAEDKLAAMVHKVEVSEATTNALRRSRLAALERQIRQLETAGLPLMSASSSSQETKK
jgi:hypothetical protein